MKINQRDFEILIRAKVGAVTREIESRDRPNIHMVRHDLSAIVSMIDEYFAEQRALMSQMQNEGLLKSSDEFQQARTAAGETVQ